MRCADSTREPASTSCACSPPTCCRASGGARASRAFCGSPPTAFAAGKTFTVNVTGDGQDANQGDGICATASGNCSLRAAIQEANANSGTDTINFNIPGAGVQTISPSTDLPPIAHAVVIDGYSQPGTSEKLYAEWLDDPEFRQEAVALVLARARQSPDALPLYRLAFDKSRDILQAREAAVGLEASGVKVSVGEHLGFLMDWYLVGPFDGKGQKGVHLTYPPEKSVDLAAESPRVAFEVAEHGRIAVGELVERGKVVRARLEGTDPLDLLSYPFEALQDSLPRLIVEHVGSDLAAVRERKKIANDADRLRKYLARFDLEWGEIKRLQNAD